MCHHCDDASPKANPKFRIERLPLLTDISFSNFRAFRRGSITVKPLTIIVGANSLGKTAILQLPLLMKQTASPGDTKFNGGLRLHGRDVASGQTAQLFHNLNTGKNIELEFGFER